MKNLWQKDTMYDVAIVGSGPAGASLAYFLSCSDLKVILIEKKKVADMPVRCAELVPKTITQLYDGKIAGINNEVNYMETYIKGKLVNTIKSPGFIMDRNKFIDFMIEEFVRKGGTYLNQTSFLNAEYLNYQNQNKKSSLNRNPENQHYGIDFTKSQVLNISVHCRHEEETASFKSKILVGADGPNSRILRIMNSFFNPGNKPDNSFHNGIQKEVQPGSLYIMAFQENLVKQDDYADNTKIFFYPYITCGYGWLFPKKSSLNIGIAISMEAVKSNGLKNVYLQFKDELIKNSFIDGSERQNSVIAGLAPVSGISHELVRNNIMLIGDAAGLCNPITGAGNFNAVLSAKIASEYIKQASSSGNPEILKEADREINNFFNSSLSHAKSKRNILEEKWKTDDFESLIMKSWISFKDYWQRVKVKNC